MTTHDQLCKPENAFFFHIIRRRACIKGGHARSPEITFRVVHNHPSGDPTPSRADIDMTREVAEAGKALGITLHDHLIIGGRRHVSFKSLGLL